MVSIYFNFNLDEAWEEVKEVEFPGAVEPCPDVVGEIESQAPGYHFVRGVLGV